MQTNLLKKYNITADEFGSGIIASIRYSVCGKKIARAILDLLSNGDIEPHEPCGQCKHKMIDYLDNAIFWEHANYCPNCGKRVGIARCK